MGFLGGQVSPRQIVFNLLKYNDFFIYFSITQGIKNPRNYSDVLPITI